MNEGKEKDSANGICSVSYSVQSSDLVQKVNAVRFTSEIQVLGSPCVVREALRCWRTASACGSSEEFCQVPLKVLLYKHPVHGRSTAQGRDGI